MYVAQVGIYLISIWVAVFLVHLGGYWEFLGFAYALIAFVVLFKYMKYSMRFNVLGKER